MYPSIWCRSTEISLRTGWQRANNNHNLHKLMGVRVCARERPSVFVFWQVVCFVLYFLFISRNEVMIDLVFSIACYAIFFYSPLHWWFPLWLCFFRCYRLTICLHLIIIHLLHSCVCACAITMRHHHDEILWWWISIPANRAYVSAAFGFFGLPQTHLYECEWWLTQEKEFQKDLIGITARKCFELCAFFFFEHFGGGEFSFLILPKQRHCERSHYRRKNH